MGNKIVEQNIVTMFVERQSLPAELHRTCHKLVIGNAPVFVTEGIVPDFVHAADNQTFLPVNATIQIQAQPFTGQLIE